MNKNELSPIERLRLEKRELKVLYLKDEQNLSEDWEYLTHNFSSLALHSLVGGVTSAFSKSNEDGESGGFINNLVRGESTSMVFSSLTAIAPLVWGIAQPLLLKYAIKKIKGIFSSKKKKGS